LEPLGNTDDEVTSVTGPVETLNGQMLLRIPLEVGGERLAYSARGISTVKEGYLEVRIPDWLAENLGIGERSLVDVDNTNGKFNITPHSEGSG
jgi:hypothetical protein